jgi:uncharacterized protein (DUF1330 family)
MHADVTDPDGYEEFKSLAAAAIADHGGRYLVRGGAMQSLEGAWRSRVILVEFPTYAAARLQAGVSLRWPGIPN